MFSTASGLLKKVTQGDSVREKNLRTKTSPADVIMWSGSKDTQTSYVQTFFFPIYAGSLGARGCWFLG